MKNYCTYFDANYLARGLTLFDSLKKVISDDFSFWVLCLDEASYKTIKGLDIKEIKPIPLHDLEMAYPDLLKAKNTRTLIEYYFTLTPFWIQYILFKNYLYLDDIAYVDADLFFYQAPKIILRENTNASIMIIPHRFKTSMRELEKYGIYNVGFLFFRNDSCSKLCLKWWADQCLEWCYDRLENDKFADQKYLDHWPKMFENVHIVQNKGVGLAPWNVGGLDILNTGKGLMIGNDCIVFFHFHGIKIYKKYFLDPNLARYSVKNKNLIKKRIYKSYLLLLNSRENMLQGKKENLEDHRLFGIKTIRKMDKMSNEKNIPKKSVLDRLFLKLKSFNKLLMGVFRNEIWIYIKGRVI